jgi:hypothetical protein
MSGREPVFRWDAYGISAFDAYWSNFDGISTISGINPHKFVRFDKYGIYGINSNDKSINGLSWHPTGESEEAQAAIDERATFALTWEGLKVKGENATLRIGDGAKVYKGDDTLLNIQDNEGNVSFAIKNDGSIIWGTSNNSSSPTQVLYSSNKSAIEDKPADNE